MRIRTDIVLTFVLVLCAVVTTSLVVRREWTAWSSERAATRPTFVQGWEIGLEKGLTIGKRAAPVQLLEFADFECPYCASLHVSLKSLRQQFGDQLSFTFLHFPIQGHAHAEPAARAVECAADQDRFEAMHDFLFENQKRFGELSWTEFARAAGVEDLGQFEKCLASDAPIVRIEEGKELGRELFDIQGTPTLVINGGKLPRAPNSSELQNMIEAVIAGRSPVER